MAAVFTSSPDPDRPTQRVPWEPQTDHTNGHPPQENGHANGHTITNSVPNTGLSPSSPFDPDRSPAAVSLRAFLLGSTLSASLLVTLYLASFTPLWRLPFFLSSLSLFHFLEFYTTALYNPNATTVSAFLLSQNGKAYNIAHSMAFLECGIHWWFFPRFYLIPGGPAWLGIGFVILVMGQAVRTTAMAHAGKNFNHLVQSKRKAGHELVTDGIYSWLRHPSYFGFFWWGLGTQVVLGNGICLLGYALVLWRFFSRRIEKEENLLIDFFGDDYVRYRAKTRVGIPLIS